MTREEVRAFVSMIQVIVKEMSKCYIPVAVISASNSASASACIPIDTSSSVCISKGRATQTSSETPGNMPDTIGIGTGTGRGTRIGMGTEVSVTFEVITDSEDEEEAEDLESLMRISDPFILERFTERFTSSDMIDLVVELTGSSVDIKELERLSSFSWISLTVDAGCNVEDAIGGEDKGMMRDVTAMEVSGIFSPIIDGA